MSPLRVAFPEPTGQCERGTDGQLQLHGFIPWGDDDQVLLWGWDESVSWGGAGQRRRRHGPLHLQPGNSLAPRNPGTPAACEAAGRDEASQGLADFHLPRNLWEKSSHSRPTSATNVTTNNSARRRRGSARGAAGSAVPTRGPGRASPVHPDNTGWADWRLGGPQDSSDQHLPSGLRLPSHREDRPPCPALPCGCRWEALCPPPPPEAAVAPPGTERNPLGRGPATSSCHRTSGPVPTSMSPGDRHRKLSCHHSQRHPQVGSRSEKSTGIRTHRNTFLKTSKPPGKRTLAMKGKCPPESGPGYGSPLLPVPAGSEVTPTYPRGHTSRTKGLLLRL